MHGNCICRVRHRGSLGAEQGQMHVSKWMGATRASLSVAAPDWAHTELLMPLKLLNSIPRGACAPPQLDAAAERSVFPSIFACAVCVCRETEVVWGK